MPFRRHAPRWVGLCVTVSHTQHKTANHTATMPAARFGSIPDATQSANREAIIGTQHAAYNMQHSYLPTYLPHATCSSQSHNEEGFLAGEACSVACTTSSHPRIGARVRLLYQYLCSKTLRGAPPRRRLTSRKNRSPRRCANPVCIEYRGSLRFLRPLSRAVCCVLQRYKCYAACCTHRNAACSTHCNVA